MKTEQSSLIADRLRSSDLSIIICQVTEKINNSYFLCVQKTDCASVYSCPISVRAVSVSVTKIGLATCYNSVL